MNSEIVLSGVDVSDIDIPVLETRKIQESFFEEFFSQLKTQQRQVAREVLESIIQCDRYMMRINGMAGTGKSFCTKRILEAVLYMGLARNIVCCAPTHQAVGVLEGYLGEVDAFRGTIHSAIGLRAKKVRFTKDDEFRLRDLQSIPLELRSETDEKRLRELTRKQIAASQRLKRFEPASKLPQVIVDCELLLVDECSMINAQIYDLIERLRDMPEMEGRDPSLKPLQVLFIGDLRQLPPVKEAISRTSEVEAFTELTEVVRYSGPILKYAHSIWEGGDPLTAHYRIPESEDFMRLSKGEVMDAVADLIQDGHDIRFLAASNKRVDAINHDVRFRLRGQEGLENYYPGDLMLTKTVIERSLSDKYVVASGGQIPSIQLGTSTIIQLGPECVPDRVITTTVETISDSEANQLIAAGRESELTVRDDKVYRVAALIKDAFSYRSALGTVFDRRIFGYSFPGNPPVKGNGVVLLLDPRQKKQYDEELSLLNKRANSAYSSSSNTTRGQNGEYAKQVFKAKGLKDWFKWSNGEPVSQWEFNDIRHELWQDYFELKNFVDDISLSYCSTVHKLQGGAADIVVLDTISLMAQRRWGGDGTWDSRKVLYTAATRARKQLVFMT